MDEGSIRYPGWRVVIACFTMAMFGYGFCYYGHGVYLAELTVGTNVDRPKFPTTTVSTATTACYLVSAFLVIFISDAFAWLGPRRVTIAGALALVLALLLVSRILSVVDLFVAYLTMSVAWATLTNAAITNILGMWFVKKRGLAISLALNGASLGGIVIAPLLVWLNGQFPFPSTLQIAAIATLPILLSVILLWIDQPIAEKRATGFASGVAISPLTVTRRSVLRTAHFWTIAAPMAFAATAQVGFIVHQVAFMLPLVGREGASLAVAVTMTMAVTGRSSLGLFIDRLDQRHVAALLLVLQAFAVLVITRSRSPLALYPACALFGIGVGILITLPPLIVQREYPSAAFGMLSSLVAAIIQLTYAFGPALLGWLRDATGGYASAFWACIALELTAAVIVVLRISPVNVTRM